MVWQIHVGIPGYRDGCMLVRLTSPPNASTHECSLPFACNWNGIHDASYFLNIPLYSVSDTMYRVFIYNEISLFLITRKKPFKRSMVKCLNCVNPLNAELNPICYLLALLGANHFLHVSRIRVNDLLPL